MNVITQVAVLAIAAAGICLAVWNVFLAGRFVNVTRAQNQRGAAYRALEAAYRSGAAPSQAQADVAAAEEAVRQAEARLPRRSKHTRDYFAKVEAS